MRNSTISTQEGCVRQKGSQWYYRFRMEEPDGTWKQHEFKGGKTKRETQAMLRQALADYREKGFVFEPGNITVNELGQMWYRDEVEHSTLTTNGKYDYQNILRHIAEHSLGETKLRNVSCEQLQAYVDEKYFGEYDAEGNEVKHAYSESHMRKQLTVLNSMFKYAVYPKQFLRENMMQYVKTRKKAEEIPLFGELEQEKRKTLTLEEYQKVLEFLQAEEKYRCMALAVQIAYHTGLRAGEICGLTWQDINLDEQYLVVRRSMYYDKNTKCWELKIPKSRKTRTVDFDRQLVQVLKKARAEQLENKLAYGELYHKHYYQMLRIGDQTHYQIFTELPSQTTVIGSRVTKGKFFEARNPKEPIYPVEFICCKPDGELMTTQSLKWCNKIVKDGVPGLDFFHFHLLRHSYATILVNHEANYKDVQSLLGHANITTTMDTYVSSTRYSRKKAADIFESALNAG